MEQTKLFLSDFSPAFVLRVLQFSEGQMELPDHEIQPARELELRGAQGFIKWCETLVVLCICYIIAVYAKLLKWPASNNTSTNLWLQEEIKEGS